MKNGNYKISWSHGKSLLVLGLGVFQKRLYEVVSRIWYVPWHRIQKKGKDTSRQGKIRTTSEMRKFYLKPELLVGEE